MALTIRNLSPVAQSMLESYMITNGIKSKATAINHLLESYKALESLKVQRNLLKEDLQKVNYRYNDVVKSLAVLHEHFKNLEE